MRSGTGSPRTLEMAALSNLEFTTEFLATFQRLSTTDQGRISRALELLDQNERHPSLSVHQLKGQQAGVWTAYATQSLRITFERLEGSRKRLVGASHHYGD